MTFKKLIEIVVALVGTLLEFVNVVFVRTNSRIFPIGDSHIRPLGGLRDGSRTIRQPLFGEFARDFPSYCLGVTFKAKFAAARAGYRIVEIPASLTPHLHGKSSAVSFQSMTVMVKVLLVIPPRLNRRPKYALQQNGDQ